MQALKQYQEWQMEDGFWRVLPPQQRLFGATSPHELQQGLQADIKAYQEFLSSVFDVQQQV